MPGSGETPRVLEKRKNPNHVEKGVYEEQHEK